MPLIKDYLPYTSLTKLKFGDPNIGDRPGGGWSRQPFVTIPNSTISNLPVEDLARTGGPDMFLRGGYLVPGRVKDDEERLLGLFTKSDRGVLFTGQQNLLSELGVRIFGGYPIGVRTANLGKLNDGTYTSLSTAAAIAGTEIGFHPNKQGIDFTGESALGRPEYIKLVKGGIFNTGNDDGIAALKNNRLIALSTKHYLPELTFLGKNFVNPENLYSYLGGPQSDKGLGKTYIKIGSDSPLRQGRNILKGYNETSDATKFSTFSQAQLLSADVVGPNPVTKVQDFRKSLDYKPLDIISSSPNYLTKNLEQRVFLGDPGKRGADRSNYTKGRDDNNRGLDQINSLYLYDSDKVTPLARKNDFVKFRIAVINNDNSEKKTWIHFRCLLENFSDNVNAGWNSFKYVGRGEDFFNYTGFSRSISLSFKVAAQSIQELSIMYQKLNYLISHMSPDYSTAGYMRGNLVEMTLGGYLFNTPGVITDITYNIPKESPWEIGIPADDTEISAAAGITYRNPEVKELPHIIDVNMTFKPIHNFLPQKVGSGYSKSENPNGINGGGEIKQRFISLEDDGDKNNLYAKGVSSDFKTDGTSTPSLGSVEGDPNTPAPQQTNWYSPPTNFRSDVPTEGQVAAEQAIQQTFPFEYITPT